MRAMENFIVKWRQGKKTYQNSTDFKKWGKFFRKLVYWGQPYDILMGNAYSLP